MVSPSKTKYSRVAANEQQKTASNKVKLVKGPRPLIYHRFYLDIQKHQLASDIESTIKLLGGKIEFFLNKEITHFITDKDYQQQAQQRAPESDGGPSSQQIQQQPATPKTPQTPRTPLSYVYQPHLQQYLNEASPSSPCVAGTPNPTPSASGSTAIKPTLPRSRADAMLQRVRQQQQRNSSNNPASAPPSSPCSPAPSTNNTFRAQLDLSQSPAHLAKSWGKPIWTTEYAIRFFRKVIETCRDQDPQQSLGKSGTTARTSSTAAEPQRKAANIQHLRGDFVKIESYQRQYRPAFQLFKKWPVLNLNTRSSASPFNSDRDRHGGAAGKSVKTTTATTNQPKTTATTNTTNNTNARAKPTQQQQRCGYCEICRIEYDVLANHLATEEHSAFVKNDANFVSLDKLISDGGVDLKTFLSENQTFVEEEEEETVKEESAKRDAESETVIGEKNTVVACEAAEEEKEEEPSEKRKKEEKEEENIRIREQVEPGRQESPKVLKTYSRKFRDKNRITRASDDPDSHGSSARSPPAKRTYAGRKQARRAAALSAPAPTSLAPAPAPVEPPEEDDQRPPAGSDDSLPPEPPKPQTDAAEAQMFGRRSAIHHHPHNTLNHHNHQKVKAARQLQQQTILNLNSVSTTVIVPEPPADEMKVLGNEPISNGPSEKEKEKDRQSKRGAADRMGLKGSSLKPTVVHHPVEMLECEGLDPKNTKRISLGLRQNPKRANLNEDFTSLLDETLGPMRKPRVRRESAKRVNYSEPREDEIASQEEIMQSILEKTAKEASENESKKKKPGSPKRPLDVKIRGIQWRAPSPQARPPVKSPLLYKVIEDPKPKTKKTTSPTKDSKEGGNHSKSNKNGLIVKIRRVRQSELSLLNDEAENFMFPKKDDSSDEQTDEDRHTTSEMEPGELSQEIPSSEPDHRNSLSMRKQACTPSGRKRTTSMKLLQPESPNKKVAKDSDQDGTPRMRRGARGPAALLQDNAEYYKFPDPGSRLRFPEAPIQPIPAEVEDDNHKADDAGKQPSPSKARGKRCRAKTPAPATMTSSSQKQHEHDLLLATRSSPSSPYQHQEQLSNCGKNIINYVKGKEDGMGVFRWSNFRKNCKEIEPYRFAFERVPSLEPWYETFQRQDDCAEIMYQYFGNTAYRKLPYEMGPLPPLKQNCCILNYRLKSKTPETAVPVSSASSCSGSSTSSTCGGLNSTTTTTNSADMAAGFDDKQPLALPLKKRKLLVDSDRPRKSPREHASTLAILSLLHQQQQHNRRRTISGCSSVPIVTTNLPPPSPTPSAYSPKKAAIQAHHNSNQEADSALGDEIRSSCGSDPVTEKEPDHGAKKIKFDPPVMVDTFVNYKAMCQELDDFLSSVGSEEDEPLFGLRKKTVAIGLKQPLKQNLVDIVRTCDKEPPLTLKQVSRHESIVRKIVQYDRKPRPLSAISIKSFDGGGGIGGSLGLFRKRINRTGWPNVKKRIVTRKQQQQQQMKVKKDGEGESDVKKENGESGIVMDGEGSRKSSTEESQISALTGDTVMVKQENDELEEEDDEDEFEDTMTMLDDEEPNGKVDTLLTDDEVEEQEEVDIPKKEECRKTPLPSKVEETVTRSVSRLGSRVLPSSKYVTKTTTTMTRVDYNVLPSSSSSSTNIVPNSSTEVLPVPNHAAPTGKGNKSTTTTNNNISSPAPAVVVEEDDKECDSISSRSIFVSDDCDTTSSTLINMQCNEDPLAIPPGSQRNSSATPQPATTEAQDEPPPELQPTRLSRPASRARQNTTRHLSYGRSRPPSKRKSDALHPVVCLEKLNCPSTMRTRSSSRTPVKTYKRSIFTSALVNSSGKPLKKKRKKKNKHKLNGINSEASIDSPSPSCSDELNSASSSLECDDSTVLACDTPTQLDRKSIKDRPPTPGPVKYSPRKLRKPRGRWYRER